MAGASASPAIVRGEETRLASDEPLNLAIRFATRVSDQPDGLVRIYSPAGDHRTQTYEQLWRRSGEIAAALSRAGARASTQVVLLLDDMLEFIPAFWACLRGGFVAVPLTSAARSSRQHDDRPINAVIARLSAPFFLTDENYRGICGAWTDHDSAKIIQLSDIGVGGEPFDSGQQSHFACLLATSGSTGRLKLVSLTHSALNYRHFAVANSPSRELPHALGLFPVDSLFGLQAVFLRHQSWTQVPASVLTAKATAALDATEEFAISTFGATNGLMQRILRDDADQSRVRDLRSLRMIGVGAEPVTANIIGSFAGLLKRHGAPSNILFAGYGTTETGSLVVGSSAFDRASGNAVPLGGPAPGVHIRVVDENSRLLSEGEAGEVQVHCPKKLFSGYWGEPEQSEASLTADGWFKTGDIGELVDGQLTLHGRLKEILIVNGIKFSLADIDSELSAVVGQGDEAYSFVFHPPGAAEQLAVVYAPQTRDGGTEASVKDAIRGAVARRFGLHASIIVAVDATSIPRTTGGKILRHHMQRLLPGVETSPSNRRERPRQAKPPTAPDLAGLERIWSDTLGVSRPVDRHANFFDLGGDSLRALTLHIRITEEFGVDVPSDAFFLDPTFDHLCRLVFSPAAQSFEERHGKKANRWQLPASLHSRLLAPFETWPGKRVTSARTILGLNTEGKKPPLFWIFNDPDEFQALATALGPSQPLYAFRSGYGVTDYSEDDIQTLALAFLSDILEVCPKGPLFIGGNCQGAILALAIAQHALRRKRHVPLLILMDWSFELQPYAGRVLFVSGRHNANHNPYRLFSKPELAWRRAFSEARFLEIPGGYAEGFLEQPIKRLVEILEKEMQSTLSASTTLMPSDAYRVSISVENSPALVSTGRRVKVRLRVTNESELTWLPTAQSGLMIGGRWIDEDGELVIQPTELTGIPEIKPHCTAVVDVLSHAPGKGGIYKLHFDVSEEGNRWFSRVAADCPAATVTVVPSLYRKLCYHARRIFRTNGDVVSFAKGQPGVQYLLSGWSSPESWGTWSDGPAAKLVVPIFNRPSHAIVTCRAYGRPGTTVSVLVKAGKAKEFTEWTLPANQTVEKIIPLNNAWHRASFEFSFPSAISPQELGKNEDFRKLGLGLVAVRLR